MSTLESAAALLRESVHTCILCKPGLLLTSEKRGIVPLLEHWEAGRLQGAFVADKIIGKAAAMLLILGGAKGVYGEVMSEKARELLLAARVETAFGSLAPYIINRKGDGLCPMEQAVLELDDPKDVPAALKATLQRLSNS